MPQPRPYHLHVNRNHGEEQKREDTGDRDMGHVCTMTLTDNFSPSTPLLLNETQSLVWRFISCTQEPDAGEP